MNATKMVLAAAVAAFGFAGAANALTVNGVVDDILTGKYRAVGAVPFATPYLGPIVAKYINYDVGRLYGPADGTYGRAVPANAGESNALAIGQMDLVANATPADYKLGAFGGAAYASEDSWGIDRITEIYDETQSVLLWSAVLAPYEMTGMFWGETDTYLDVSGTGTVQKIHGVGFETSLYVDDTPDFSQLGGPVARTGLDSYPTATDGLLFWSMNGLAGAADTTFPLDEFLTTFNPGVGPGTPNVGDGKVHGTFGPNASGVGGANGTFDVPTGPDWSLRFTGISPPTAAVSAGLVNWTVQSNDPLVTTAIPTPAAIYGGLLGLGMLVGRKTWRMARA